MVSRRRRSWALGRLNDDVKQRDAVDRIFGLDPPHPLDHPPQARWLGKRVKVNSGLRNVVDQITLLWGHRSGIATKETATIGLVEKADMQLETHAHDLHPGLLVVYRPGH